MSRSRSRNDATKRRHYSLMLTLWRAQGGICAGCGKPLPPFGQAGVKRVDQLSIDHTVPRALGGVDRLGNMTCMHKLCNEMKTDDMPTGCEAIWLLAVNARIGMGPQKW